MINKKMDNVFLSVNKQNLTSTEKLFNELTLLYPNFLKDGVHFQDASDKLKNDIFQFQRDIENIPIISLIIMWANALTLYDSYHAEKNIKLMIELLQSGLFKYQKSGINFFLKEYPSHEIIMGEIRSKKEWSITKQEEIIRIYVEFSDWLSKNTYGFIIKAEDNDRAISLRRKLPFDNFIKLMSELELRERLLVKLFYFGESPSRDEVFSLKVEDVDFQNNCIGFSSHKVRYPLHVFRELSDLIGERTTGFVFKNRKGEKMDHTGPYKNLKQAVIKLNLDPKFAFRDLSQEH